MICRKSLLLISLYFIIAASLFGQETGAKYLVIAHDQFYNAALPLAAWKHKKGMRAKIVRLSDVGSTADQIRNYILDAYNNWQIKPEFLLLVGAPNFIPFPQSGTYTDNYYTDMNGDVFNDILSGRLTVHDTLEAKTVVNKILVYERHPDTSDTSRFLKGVAIANTDGSWTSDSIYLENMRYWAQLMDGAGYVGIDTLADIYGDNSTDVINAVNEGCMFVVYRGSGLNNWYSPFNCNPDASNNGVKLPIVLSMTCCCMGTGATPAVAERWFLTGTPTTPKGAAGYFSTTTVIGGGAHLRSAVNKGFASAVFMEGKKTFGEACEKGRMNVYHLYGATNEYRGWTTIGDPEMNIWISNPRRPVITHPVVVHLGYNSITVNVNVNGQPEPAALVCAMQSDTIIYETGLTDSSGNVSISFTVPGMDTIYLTVTGHTLLPYEGYILVSPEGSFVTYLKHEIVDTVSGNNNGRANPGEIITLPVWVKNYGSDTALGVTGVLRVTGSIATVIDSLTDFLDIAPNDSALSDPPFIFDVDSFCDDQARIDFDLSCISADDTFPSVFSVYVCAPKLIYDHSTVTGGNGNNTLEPGETANLILAVENTGSETAADPHAVCRVAASTYLRIDDSVSIYQSIAPDSVRDNVVDPFIITADSMTPIGTTVDLSVEITTGWSVDTIEFFLVVGKKNYLIWNPDQTPNPGIVMNSTLTALGYTGDYATSLPADLTLYQAVFVCVGVYPNNLIIYAGSPEATALVDFMNSGGRLYLEGGDVWYYDPMMNGYNFAPHFGIQPAGDGSSDMGPVAGANNAFTAGMIFQYGGENQFMDQINPTSGSFLIFSDQDDYYNCGVAYNAGNYRTVGASFELGALIDASGVSTKGALLDSIMHFFGIYTGIQEEPGRMGPNAIVGFRAYPNPSTRNLTIKFQISSLIKSGTKSQISIKIYDTTGRLVKSFYQLPITQLLDYSITWDGTDEVGRIAPAGVYFIHLDTGDDSRMQKVIIVR
ncbi:MAG TPA: C25 family cysteine peptidase [bacterium]